MLVVVPKCDGRQGLAAPARNRAYRPPGEERRQALGAVGCAQGLHRSYVAQRFRFAIRRLEGKWKMSQNREMQDRDGIAKGLGKRDNGDDLEMAEIVLRHMPSR
jgi:predicted FMN-binding regulatory protein PaiB